MPGRSPSDDRGQTPQDFAIGMSIFLLAVITVLAFVPSIFTPFTGPASAVDGQADRASAAAMSELTVEGSTTTLNRTATASWFATYQASSTDTLATELGLQSYRSVNVSVYRLDGSERSDVVALSGTDLTAGEPYTGQPSSTMVRIVRIDGACDTGCRMVVRVW